jgi:hypothetical protein
MLPATITHPKVSNILPCFKQIWIFSADFHKIPLVPNSTEICPVEAVPICWKDRYDEANRYFM